MRLQGFARGADDYLSKPFSPKELVARIRRLLARAAEAREARRRGHEAEAELARAREDVKRAHLELRKEQRLRGLTAGIARELHGTLDPADLAARFLLEIQTQVGATVAALLVREPARAAFVPVAIRGDGIERVMALDVSGDGELAQVLAALGRPARRAELERFPELRRELLGLVAAGFDWLAPLRVGDRLEGILLVDERADGRDVSRADVDVLALLCDAAAGGLESARRCAALADRWIETASASARAARTSDEDRARHEAAERAGRAARALMMPAWHARLVEHAVDIGPWAMTPGGRRALAEAAEADPTGRLRDLALVLDAAGANAEPELIDDDPLEPAMRQAAELSRAAARYVEARARGSDADEALREAIDGGAPALDTSIRQALRASHRDERTREPRTA
jgi:GAF domain-containing protein